MFTQIQGPFKYKYTKVKVIHAFQAEVSQIACARNLLGCREVYSQQRMMEYRETHGDVLSRPRAGEAGLLSQYGKHDRENSVEFLLTRSILATVSAYATNYTWYAWTNTFGGDNGPLQYTGGKLLFRGTDWGKELTTSSGTVHGIQWEYSWSTGAKTIP